MLYCDLTNQYPWLKTKSVRINKYDIEDQKQLNKGIKLRQAEDRLNSHLTAGPNQPKAHTRSRLLIRP